MAKWARPSLVLLVVVAAAFVGHLAFVSPARGPVSAVLQPFGPRIHRTFWLAGRSTNPGIGWNRTLPGPSLTANDGDNVTIMLQSNDTITHSWFIDFNNNGIVDLNERATRSKDFNSTTNPWYNFTFTASLGKTIPHGGTFLYLCEQHVGQMWGRFTFDAGPIALFTHSPSTPLVGHLVNFDGSTSWPATGATITDYSWNFADGNTTSSSTSPTIAHTYSTNKTFTAVLTITDSASHMATTTGNVTVLNPPPVPFDFQITITPVNATIFAGQSTATLVSLSLVSGAPENVSLASSLLPAISTIHLTFNVTSGFPSFHSGLSIVAGSSNGSYNITIIAMSSTGVAHNATFTLGVKLLPTICDCGLNYFFYAVVGAVVAIAILAVFLIFRRRQGRTNL